MYIIFRVVIVLFFGVALNAENNLSKDVLNPPPPVQNNQNSYMEWREPTQLEKIKQYNDCMNKYQEAGKCEEEKNNKVGTIKFPSN